MRTPLIAALCLASFSALAQNIWTAAPLGGGWYTHSDSYGNTVTSVPLGGGWYSHAASDGSSATTARLGGGWSTTTVSPGFGNSSGLGYKSRGYSGGYDGLNW